MANTTNLVLPLLDSGQAQHEVTANAALTIVDDACFIRKGTLASRPAASKAGRLFWATDAGNEGWSRDTGSTWESFGAQHVNWSGGTAPTAAAGANAGTGPPAPVVSAGSDDTRGRITFGTGTGPAAGSMVVVTFAGAFGAAPTVLLTPRNGQTYNIGMFLFAVSTTSFTVGAAGVPAGSQGNTVYDVGYLCVG